MHSPALLCVNFNYGTLCEFMHHFAYFTGVTVEEFGSSRSKNVLECTRQRTTVDDIFYSRSLSRGKQVVGRYNATSETMLLAKAGF